MRRCSSIVNFAKIMILDYWVMGTNVSPLVALVVSLTILGTVVFAKTVGCLLPLFAKKIKLDPTVMASPFITTLVDTVSLLIYFTIASLLLSL